MTEKPRAAGNGRANGPVAAVADGRPVRRLGLIAEDELDVPTWQRRRQEPPVAAARAQREQAAAPPPEESGDDYDIPTFLRRGAE